MNDLVKYARDRDAALIECINEDTLEPFKAFVEKYRDCGIYPSCFALPSDEVIEISVRQMALHCTNIPAEVKGRAVDWLTSRGCHLDFTQ